MKKLVRFCGFGIALTFIFYFNMHGLHRIGTLLICAILAAVVALCGVVAAQVAGSPSLLRDADAARHRSRRCPKHEA